MYLHTFMNLKIKLLDRKKSPGLIINVEQSKLNDKFGAYISQFENVITDTSK